MYEWGREQFSHSLYPPTHTDLCDRSFSQKHLKILPSHGIHKPFMYTLHTVTHNFKILLDLKYIFLEYSRHVQFFFIYIVFIIYQLSWQYFAIAKEEVL